MRILICALAIALMTVPAYAQATGMGGRKNQQQDEQKKAEDKAKTKADEEAYKEALKHIPAPAGKPDPWKSVR